MDTPPEISRSQYNKSKALVSALNNLLPSPHDLDILLDSSSRWFTIWRQMFPEIADHRCETIKESISHSLRSDNPAAIAKVMICIAISVHQMPADFDWARLRLRDDPKELVERYITTINQLITADDEIAATIDGIECMVLEAKYHVNMGRPRRAWLLFHRAIAFCQLLGLHRLSARKPENKNDMQYKRQVSLWSHLFLGDRYLSLVLGLPYSVSDAFCTPYIPPIGFHPPDVPEGDLYASRMVPLVTKIIDRNQSPAPMPYSATLRLDQDLEELHNQYDPSWWSLERVKGSTIEEHFSRMQAHFFHHQTRTILHMPFMLKSSADKRYQYSHQAALESAREMIKCYRVLRSDREVGPYICKLVDFQAFTAAMLLLLNLCGYAQHTRGAIVQQPDLDQDQLDSDLIDTTVSLLHAASGEAGGIVAAQSAKTLEMLGKVRHCGEDKDCTDDAGQSQTCQVSIPYFGTITLGIGKHFVPIKKGTYPEPGETRKASMTARQTAQAINTGLPTPPSMCSNSTQPSPMSSTLDSAGSTSHNLYRAPTDYNAPGLGQTYDINDAFITFDSFMALPSQDFPSSGSLGASIWSMSSGMTPQSFPATAGAFDANASGFPFGASGNVDLDHGWSWSGDLQW
jgi:Fungal specific transcription factor domain